MDQVSRALLAAGGGAVAANYIEDVFSTYLYTGNGSSQTITNGIDLSGKGGMTWFKKRTDATQHHVIVDSARGQNALHTGLTNAQSALSSGAVNYTSSGMSFTGGVFSSNGDINNASGETYASWTFRKQPKFFDVVTYTGNGTTNLVSHSLGAVPGFVIVKCTSNAGSWWVTARRSDGFYSSQGNLNSTAAFQNNGNLTAAQWGLTSTTINADLLGPFSTDTNQSGNTYVAYLFAHDAGGFGASGADNVISCGSYVGNGSTTAGQIITLGYEPQWLMIKNASQTGDWVLVDSMRGLTNGGREAVLLANSSNAETSESRLTPLATGFELTTSGPNWNTNGDTYIYIAIRRGPMRTPTSGTQVYGAALWTGNGTSNNVVTPGIDPDLYTIKRRSSTQNNYFFDRLRGFPKVLGDNPPGLKSTSTAAESTNDTWGQSPRPMTSPGITINQDSASNFAVTSETYVSYAFKRAPGFFDVVCYTGTGANRTVSHNLGVAPELMIVKYRNDGLNSDTAYPWTVYHSALGAGFYLRLNETNASTADNGQWNGAPTSSLVNLGTNGYTNGNTYTYVAYLFATVAGVSKVGSYTGNGSSQTINCGFTTGARFVLVKRTDSTGDWYVWDTARGIVSANDPHLSLNSTAAEVTTNDSIDPDNTGFIVNQVAATNINVSSATYIFLAIA